MEFRSLFSGKNKKNFINLLFTEFTQRVVWLIEDSPYPLSNAPGSNSVVLRRPHISRSQ